MQITLKVAMACSGCEGAVRRVLQNKPGRLCLCDNKGIVALLFHGIMAQPVQPFCSIKWLCCYSQVYSQ